MNEVGRWVAAFFDRARRHGRARPDPAGRLGDTVVGHVRGPARRPARPAHRPHGHGVRRRDRGERDRSGSRTASPTGPGVTDMKSGLLAGLYAPQGDHRSSGGGLPFERLVVRGQPRRGDRLADVDAAHPGTRRGRRRRARARVRAGERRHRLGAQGHPRPADRRSTAARRTRAWSRRRAAARSSRPPASSRDLHALNGRWPGVTVNVGVIARRDAPQRRRRALHARGRRPGHDTRGARDRRGRDPPDRRGDRGPRHDRRLRADGPLVADGEAGAERPACRARRRQSRGRSVSRSRDAATGGASDANTTSGLGVPESRRPRPDRRQRSRPGRIPRGRVDRAADDAPGRAPASDRGGSRGPRLALGPRDASRRRYSRRRSVSDVSAQMDPSLQIEIEARARRR